MNSDRIKNMTATAMLFALAIVLSLIESLLWQPINGAKLGLSNMVVMFAMTSLGYSSALGIGTLKSIFVFLTRGATAGLLSFGGFALSFCVMLILHRLLKDKLSYLLLSVVGALGHNLGQLIIISALYSSSLALSDRNGPATLYADTEKNISPMTTTL